MNDYSHLVTFASPDMERSMRLCCDSAAEQGVNQVWPWYQATLKTLGIYRKHRVLFDNPKGAGLWAWKPFVIQYEMAKVPTDCYLIYADAGLEFIEPVQTVIDKMDQDIWLFGNQHLHARWCKRDIIEAIWPLRSNNGSVGATLGVTSKKHIEWARFGTQAQASVIFFRVNDYTRKFVKEWLHWCLYGVQTYTEVDGYKMPKAIHYLIDDSPSVAPNHPEFIENRHDQAILTTMAYREGIKLHAWYVEYEGYTPVHLAEYPREFDRPLYYHHRFRNSDWEARGIKVA